MNKERLSAIIKAAGKMTAAGMNREKGGNIKPKRICLHQKWNEETGEPEYTLYKNEGENFWRCTECDSKIPANGCSKRMTFDDMLF